MAKSIKIEKSEAGVYGFVAVDGDVQIGWCRNLDDGWYVEDTDYKPLVGPFKTLKEAKEAGFQLLDYLAGAGNPGH